MFFVFSWPKARYVEAGVSPFTWSRGQHSNSGRRSKSGACIRDCSIVLPEDFVARAPYPPAGGSGWSFRWGNRRAGSGPVLRGGSFITAEALVRTLACMNSGGTTRRLARVAGSNA